VLCGDFSQGGIKNISNELELAMLNPEKALWTKKEIIVK
jgi:hypothetical protein